MSAEPVATAPAKGPRHVALIMDGNGRWAERRGLPRVVGHREGVQALDLIGVLDALALRVEVLELAAQLLAAFAALIGEGNVKGQHPGRRCADGGRRL